jgi:glycosyltransferase involved in cell wall biosynthesis
MTAAPFDARDPHTGGAATARLTVAIPSYNRNEILNGNLRLLLPQLDARSRVLIIDNCSDRPVADSVEPLRREFPDARIDIVRNRVNVGANANIIRCYELCETDWIWTLGDDDAPQPDAIAAIHRHLDQFSDCIYLNFSYDGMRPETFTTIGLRDFAEKLDLSSNLPFISAAVAKTNAMLPQLKIAYLFAYSMLPHVALLFASIGENGRCCFSSERLIIDPANAAPTTEHQWSMLNLALGHAVLFDQPFASDVRRLLATKLLRTRKGESLPLRSLARQLLLAYRKNGDRQSMAYYFEQIAGRAYWFDRSFKRRAEILAYRLLLRFPALGFRLLGTLYRLTTGRHLDGMAVPDRFSRS